MVEMLFRAVIGVGIVAAVFGLFAFSNATAVNANLPEVPVQVSTWELKELPKPTSPKADHRPANPCDVVDSAGHSVESGVKGAPVEDPYAG